MRLFFILLFSLAAYAQETTTTIDTTTTTAEETTTTTTTIEETTTTSTTSTSTTSTTLWPKTVTLAWDDIACAVNIYEVVDGSYVLKGAVSSGTSTFVVVDVTPGKHCYVAECDGIGSYSNQACFYQDRGRARLLFRPRVIP